MASSVAAHQPFASVRATVAVLASFTAVASFAGSSSIGVTSAAFVGCLAFAFATVGNLASAAEDSPASAVVGSLASVAVAAASTFVNLDGSFISYNFKIL